MGLEVRNCGILITEEQSSYSKPTGARYCFIVSLLEVLHNVVAYDLIAEIRDSRAGVMLVITRSLP